MVQRIEKSPLSYIPVSTFIPNIEDFAKEAKRVFTSKLGANSLSYLDVPLQRVDLTFSHDAWGFFLLISHNRPSMKYKCITSSVTLLYLWQICIFSILSGFKYIMSCYKVIVTRDTATKTSISPVVGVMFSFCLCLYPWPNWFKKGWPPI